MIDHKLLVISIVNSYRSRLVSKAADSIRILYAILCQVTAIIVF